MMMFVNKTMARVSDNVYNTYQFLGLGLWGMLFHSQKSGPD
jgi:hypothetical protein